MVETIISTPRPTAYTIETLLVPATGGHLSWLFLGGSFYFKVGMRQLIYVSSVVGVINLGIYFYTGSLLHLGLAIANLAGAVKLHYATA